MSWLALVQNGNWTPRNGDPTITGWVTVLAYLGVATLVWFLAARMFESRLREVRRAAMLWAGIGLVMVGLGINKQLDLQSAMTEYAKAMAMEDGWYADRRVVQRWFIVGIGVTGVLGIGAVLYLGRRYWRQFVLAGLGLGFLAAFVVIRAASFHHVDVFLKSPAMGWVNYNVVLELGGIGLIGVGAWREMRKWRRGHEAMMAA